MKKKLFIIFLSIFAVLFVFSCVQTILSVTISNPYIRTDNIVYHLDEDKTIKEIEITIVNPSCKTYSNQEFFLRYCREDNYPEMYTSPVIISLAPFETKTIKIYNFRNTYTYNENYHLEIDHDLQKNTEISMAKGMVSYVTPLFTTLSVVFAVPVIVFSILLFNCIKKEKKLTLKTK